MRWWPPGQGGHTVVTTCPMSALHCLPREVVLWWPPAWGWDGGHAVVAMCAQFLPAAPTLLRSVLWSERHCSSSAHSLCSTHSSARWRWLTGVGHAATTVPSSQAGGGQRLPDPSLSMLGCFQPIRMLAVRSRWVWFQGQGSNLQYPAQSQISSTMAKQTDPPKAFSCSLCFSLSKCTCFICKFPLC